MPKKKLSSQELRKANKRRAEARLDKENLDPSTSKAPRKGDPATALQCFHPLLPASNGPAPSTLCTWIESLGKQAKRRVKSVFVDIHSGNKVTLEIFTPPKDSSVNNHQAIFGRFEVRCRGIKIPVDHLGVPDRIVTKTDVEAICNLCDSLHPCVGIPALQHTPIYIEDMSRWGIDRQQLPCRINFTGSKKLGAVLRQGTERDGPYLAAPSCALACQADASGTPRCTACRNLLQAVEQRLAQSSNPSRPAHQPEQKQATASARAIARLLGRCKTLRIHAEQLAFPMSATLVGTPLSLICGADKSVRISAPWTSRT
eukprot:scaffold38123_cov31-Prasinocladus_malaysianus.AAC.2